MKRYMGKHCQLYLFLDVSVQNHSPMNLMFWQSFQLSKGGIEFPYSYCIHPDTAEIAHPLTYMYYE